MLGLLPGGSACPLPSASETQRRVSRTVFNVISTGSALHREGLTVARAATHLPLTAVEGTTGADVSGVRRCLDGGFDAVQDVSDRAEDRFLTTLLSTSQLTAEGAEFLDDTAEGVVAPGEAVGYEDVGGEDADAGDANTGDADAEDEDEN